MSVRRHPSPSPQRKPASSGSVGKCQMEFRYGRYLREFLLHSIVQDEHVAARDACVRNDLSALVKTLNFKKETTAMWMKNEELHWMLREIKLAETIIESYTPILEQAETHEKLERLTQTLANLLDGLPVLNCPFEKPINGEALKHSVDTLNEVTEKGTGTSVVGRKMLELTSCTKDLKRLQSEARTLHKLNNQLARLNSMKICLSDDYAQEIALDHGQSCLISSDQTQNGQGDNGDLASFCFSEFNPNNRDSRLIFESTPKPTHVDSRLDC